jgi:hypothetical protein
MSYFVGNTPGDTVGDSSVRYFYAIRRTDDGLIYFVKVDNLQDEEASVIINNPGFSDDDFQDFEYGVDFFDGRAESDHSRPYKNLQWDQYRWDNRRYKSQ